MPTEQEKFFGSLLFAFPSFLNFKKNPGHDDSEIDGKTAEDQGVAERAVCGIPRRETEKQHKGRETEKN
jgi:hypothetical protein